jgi:peptide/nickel transport system substrate-binding protein
VSDTLRLLFWQPPTILNPHLARGMSDFAAARCCFEPLLTADAAGRLTPVLAAEVPSAENGGLPDERTVIYRLLRDVTWADGQPFTADDVVFTAEILANPENTATTINAYRLVERVEALDPYTVRVTFREPTAGWYVPFVGSVGMILPRHALEGLSGAAFRSAPFNLKPFGTGPYVVDDFAPGDLVTYSANPRYREPGRPSFSRLLVKSGGDPVSAARVVLQTGEYDFAPFLQVEAEILDDLTRTASTGDLLLAPGAGVEMILLNQADPWHEIDGERSHPSSHHPYLADPVVREALALAVDRSTIAARLFGASGSATANILTTPLPLASTGTRIQYDVERANQLLDGAGYGRGSDGVRVTPAGQRMMLLLSSTVSAQRQKVQAIVKDGWQRIGVETEIRAVAPAAFLASPDNPDSAFRFPADAIMLTIIYSSPFPAAYMRRYYAGDPARDWAQRANNWSGTNILKWQDRAYDRLYDEVLTERDPERGRALWHRLNDALVGANSVIPVIDRSFVSAKARGLLGPAPGPFDLETWNIATWTR